MAIDPVAIPVHERLAKLGFRRKARVWNRDVGGLVDVISIRTGKTGSAFTVDVGVLDPAMFRLCWDREPRDPAIMPECTVQAEIGTLASGKGMYWEHNDPGTPASLDAVVSEFGLPFLSKMHDPAAMETFLGSRPSLFSGYDPVVIYLAGLKAQLGKTAEACSLLAQRDGSIVWATHLSRAMASLGCK